MAVFELSISSLYQNAFGTLRGKPFNAGELNKVDIDKAEFEVDFVPTNNSGQFTQIRNQLNAFMPTGEPIFLPCRIGGLLLPNEPTISISNRKTIVETPMVGRNGTVKELINLEDYELTIRGIALNHQDTINYPEDMIKALHQLYRRNESLEIECGLTALLNLKYIVLKSFSLPEMQGVQHAQAYEFTAVTDTVFTLIKP
jgi:hypothetical protein